LIKVNGVRMIDTVIKGLSLNGINEIYIVVGHLKEQFEELSSQYPEVKLIENPYYRSSNNITSLYVARDYLEDSIILDGDQIIYNPDILDPHFIQSGYNAIWTDDETEEWLMEVKDGVVTGCSRTGGSHGWQLFSISRWTKEDGRKLRKHLEMEYEKENFNIYWDDVVMFLHFNEYNLGIKEMNKSDVIEIDKLEELVAIDNSYQLMV